jgi:hypothetical protein
VIEAHQDTYFVQLNEMTLYREEIGNEGEGFVELCISKHPFSTPNDLSDDGARLS